MSCVAHEPTSESRAEVAALVSFGIIHEHIARMLKISADTLVKYYSYELETGLQHAINKVANVLFQKAMDGDMSAAMFYLKTRAKWREKDPDDNKALNSVIELLADKLAAKQ